MCFSTEASFTAAAALGVTGLATIRSTTLRSQLFLAAIPLLFAIQQFSEGVLWYHFSEHSLSPFLTASFERTYLIFAFLLWPIWIPFSVAQVEQILWRRRFIYAILALGLGLTFLNISYSIGQEPIVRVVNHSLQYIGNVPSQMIIYPLIVILPCFLSSYRSMWIFGILITFGYIIADWFYTQAFVSVWCFFAALVSVSIYKVIRDNRTDSEKIRSKEIP